MPGIGLVGTMVTTAIIVLAISLPIGLSDDPVINTTVLGDPYGGNTRAALFNGTPAPPVQLFPLHDPSRGEDVSFTTEHRCLPTCQTDYSSTCTDERYVSNNVFAQGPEEDIPDPRGLSSLSAFFGQLVDHDMSKTRTEDTTFCSISLADLGPMVSPIAIKRTLVTLGNDACRNPRLFITPYLDGTPWYGDYLNPERALSLRELTLGKLRLTAEDNLPRDPAKPQEFLAGDTRASEHVVLALLHTVFARQHNRIVAMLHEDVPTWSDEQLYWKARRIVNAQYQRIIYEEWLPALFGTFYGQTTLGLEGVEEACRMDHGVVGTTILKTEFAQAAFRYGHSAVPNRLGVFNLTDLFFNATLFEELGADRVTMEMVATPAQRVDAKVVDTLRNTLFGTHGLDLVSLNIARGRELGVAGYDDTATCYSGTPHQNRRSFSHQDLFVRLLEDPLLAGSSLPELLAKIIASQFLDLCRGDRFFYARQEAIDDIGTKYYPLVTSATIKGILVDNTNVDPASVPDNAFFMPV